MADHGTMRVFISWSGRLAQGVAAALRRDLPLLFDGLELWMSENDIAAGQRGLKEIEDELKGAEFGIVVVTSSNQGATWLNFEAGALSRTVGGGRGGQESRVVPLLVDFSSTAQLQGPLSQFQAKMADRDGLRALARSLAAVAGADESLVLGRFDGLWRRLKESIEEARRQHGLSESSTPERPMSDMLEEILVLVRGLRTAEAAASKAAPQSARTADATPDESAVAQIRRLAEKHGLRFVMAEGKQDDGTGTITFAALKEMPAAEALEIFELEPREMVGGDFTTAYSG